MKLTRVFVPSILFVIASGQAQEPAVFTSDTNLVIIPVTVKDKSGKVMPGLKKEDFTILEDGKPQKIAVFDFQQLEGDVSLPPVPAVKPVPEAAPAAPAAPAPPKPKTAAAAPTPTTAAPVIRFQDRRLVAMLFDFQHHGDSGTESHPAGRSQIHSRTDETGRHRCHPVRQHRPAKNRAGLYR